tara:strand:- start:6168 stop:6581 length:414 start_codon:yes stop_codon:yes gene_type:complete
MLGKQKKEDPANIRNMLEIDDITQALETSFPSFGNNDIKAFEAHGNDIDMSMILSDSSISFFDGSWTKTDEELQTEKKAATIIQRFWIRQVMSMFFMFKLACPLARLSACPLFLSDSMSLRRRCFCFRVYIYRCIIL